MKNFKKIYLQSIFLMVLFVSCSESFLDITPKGRVIPQTVEDIELIFNDEDIINTSDTPSLELSADNFSSFSTQVDVPESLDQALYTWDKEIFTLQHNNILLWSAPYANIAKYNTVLEELGLIDGDETVKKELRAEAKLGRAFEYWLLVNSFAKQYNGNTASQDLGVPLLIENDITQNIASRSTVENVYDFMIDEVKEIINDLPTVKKNDLRATKGAGYAFLSRIYLFKADYENALEYANLALNENNFLADYNSVSATVSVFQADDLKPLDTQENYYLRMSSRAVNGRVFEQSFIDLFEENDLRKRYFSFNPGFGDLFFTPLFNNIAFSTPEMYLTRAECNARLGNIDLAMQDLNELRAKRITDPMLLTASMTSEAMPLILKERRVETFRNGLRWFDLKRLNLEADYATTITHDFQGNEIQLLPNSNNYVFPIPAQVIEFNPDITNNERD